MPTVNILYGLCKMYFVLYTHLVLSASHASHPEHPLTDLRLVKAVECGAFSLSLTDRQHVSFVPELPLGSQPLAQQAQLPEEAVIGSDFSFLSNHGQSGVNIHVLAKHQVGYD